MTNTRFPIAARGARAMSLERILSEIITERQCQDAMWGPDHDDAHSPADWAGILVRHLGLAMGDGASVDPERFRKQLVRVAAVAVAAVEAIDRKAGREHAAGRISQ